MCVWTYSRVCKYTAQVGCQKRHYDHVEDDELHACNNAIASSARTKEDDFPCIAVEERKGGGGEGLLCLVEVVLLFVSSYRTTN